MVFGGVPEVLVSRQTRRVTQVRTIVRALARICLTDSRLSPPVRPLAGCCWDCGLLGGLEAGNLAVEHRHHDPSLPIDQQPAWQRRHPILASVWLMPKLYLKGAFR